MNSGFKKFCKEINYEITEELSNLSIENLNFNKETGILNLNFRNLTNLKFSEFENFWKSIKNFKIPCNVNFKYDSLIINENMIMPYLDFAFDSVYQQKKYFQSKRIEIENECIKILFKSELELNKMLEEQKNVFLDFMKKIGYEKLDFSFEMDKEHQEEIIRQRQEYLNSLNKPIINTINDGKKVKLNNIENGKKQYFNSIHKDKKYHEMSIIEALTSYEKFVMVKGEIFKYDTVVAKSGILITILTITDYNEAIKVRIFSKTEAEKEEQAKYQPGSFVYVSGELQYDEYSKSKIINAKSVIFTESLLKTRQDDAEEKRIEFAAKTTMTAMDGIASAKDYIKAIKNFGHEAIAIADLDSVQAFPEFYNESKKAGIKAIYGATFSTIETNNGTIINPINQTLKNSRYVVFDLETTGLSPRFNEIIEFGAVIVENNEIKDTIQFFVKPEKEIPIHIVELTKITDEMVKNAIDQEAGIKRIREILDNSIAVAHNANFDISFVNEKLDFFKLEPLNISTIDSLKVARLLNPDSKKFRLENLALRLGVEYDASIAHRADYDAEVLGKVWINFLKTLSEKGIYTINDLINYHEESLESKKFPNEIGIYAKNQAGLKELFKLISFASTENFYGGPRLYFDKLQKSPNLFLASGTLKSRLIEKLLFSTRINLINEIDHYDIIEVPGPRDFIHLINRNFFDLNTIKAALKDLILTAKAKGKVVIAVSDARYVNVEDKIFHEIYINAKGLGGVRHYLYKYGETNPIYPNQNILTTKEMIEEFSFLGDFNIIKEIVITNPKKIADQIEFIEVIKDKLYPPIFDNSKEKLPLLVYKTAKEKYGENLPEIVENRIKKELEPILKYGFDVVYWISHKLVAKSLSDGYLVGSRGSVGSSLVATMAGITEVNPLVAHYVCKKCKKSEFFENGEYQSGFDLPDKNCDNCNIPFLKDGQTIPFETFLGFNADKVPDIDLNFSGEYQINVHNEIRDLFGENHTFRAGTISTNAEKTVYGYIKSFAEETQKEYSHSFMEFLSFKASGVKRTTGQHPGGIIVIPKEFDAEDFTPINFPANNDSSTWKTTHFDFHAIHDNVLKLDILGHDDPTAIKMLEELTNIKAKNIPTSDPKILSLFSSLDALGINSNDISGETTGAMGIPEFGTQFVRGMLKTAKVKSFADLVAISGLSHGTDVWKGNAEDLILNKNLTFQEVVSCRDDIMVYLINKGLDASLSFKIMESVRKGKSVTPEWEKIMLEHKVPEWYIDSLKKIKYMFPKAHATAYVLMAWRIAYYKLYHPLAYYATYFSTRTDVSDIETLMSGKNVIHEKLKEFKNREFIRGEKALSAKEKDLIPIFSIAEEMYARGYTISNISLEKSHYKNWLLDEQNKTLIPPFSSLDGLGEAVAKSICNAREEKWFISIEDFKNRTSINKTLLEKMRNLNILDKLSETNQQSLF